MVVHGAPMSKLRSRLIHLATTLPVGEGRTAVLRLVSSQPYEFRGKDFFGVADERKFRI